MLPKYLTSPKTKTKKKTNGAIPVHKKYSIRVLITREAVEKSSPGTSASRF